MYWLSQPSVVNECPLVVPNTSRPLRLCVRNKNMFLCSSVPKNSVSSVSSVWKIPSKGAEQYVLLFFCQNYRPTEIRVLQPPRKSAPSAWQKSPLVVPNTLRPLRLCVKICFYVLLSQKICEFREFRVKIKICSSVNRTPPRIKNF